MSRTRRTGPGAGEDLLPWIVPGAAFLIGTVFLGAWLGGTLGAAVSGAGFGIHRRSPCPPSRPW